MAAGTGFSAAHRVYGMCLCMHHSCSAHPHVRTDACMRTCMLATHALAHHEAAKDHKPGPSCPAVVLGLVAPCALSLIPPPLWLHYTARPRAAWHHAPC